MESLFLKVCLLFTLFLSTNAYSQTNVDCISHGDLERIAKDFSQFVPFVSNKTEYCEGDMDVQFLKIANSLAILMNTQANEPTLDEEDAFTYQAIAEKNWWTYFTKRANRFVIQKNCPQNVVAYVQPFFGQGVINLCLLFFDFSVSSQASTMMHEVRHFDGHGHVACTQGNESGISGACDATITGKGSYAISVQTLVGMARSKDTKANEKSLLEAEAVYMAFNKFNIAPKIKLKNSLIMSNAAGEVYQWVVGQGMELINTLVEASIVTNSSNNLTVFPLNTQSEAYRMDKKLAVKVDNPGLYAVSYNKETPLEREKYKSITYFGAGGMLKGNSLLTLCDVKNLVIGESNLDSKGQFVSIISMSLDSKDQTRESLLLADNGDLYRYECRDKTSQVVNFTKTSMKMAAGIAIVDSFGFDGEQYGLMEDGSLSILSIENNIVDAQIMNLPVNNTGWVSATPLSQPEVF